MCLIHRRQECARIGEVGGFGRESSRDGVVEPDPPERVIQVARQAEGGNPRNLRLDLESVGFALVKACVRVENDDQAPFPARKACAASNTKQFRHTLTYTRSAN